MLYEIKVLIVSDKFRYLARILPVGRIRLLRWNLEAFRYISEWNQPFPLGLGGKDNRWSSRGTRRHHAAFKYFSSASVFRVHYRFLSFSLSYKRALCLIGFCHRINLLT